MADKKDKLHEGNDGDSVEQKRKQKNPDTDEDPQRENDKTDHRRSEDNPDDLEK